MNNQSAFSDTYGHNRHTGQADQLSANPWAAAFRYFTGNLRRSVLAIVLCALIGGVIGLTVRSYLPRTYYSKAQLLFDPSGFKVFNNPLKVGVYDANAAINFVESQMVVMQSERVLSRVLRTQCASLASPAQTASAAGGKVFLKHSFTKLCPASGETAKWSKALKSVSESIDIYRQGRNFVVTVQASGPTPAAASRLASAVIAAYKEEGAQTRKAAAQKLGEGMAARLRVLRRKLRVSELKAERYARTQNLTKVDGRTVVTGNLSSAIAALKEASRRTADARASWHQLKSGTVTADSIGALAGNANVQAMQRLVASRDSIQSDIASLRGRAGRKHPLMRALSSKLAKTNASISAQARAVRNVSRTKYRSALAQEARLKQEVAKYKNQSGLADQAAIEMRVLQQDVAANKKLVETFETRMREASEFSRIDADNLRVVSIARAPPQGRFWPRFILAGLAGALVGVMFAISGVLLSALFSIGRAQRMPNRATPHEVPGSVHQPVTQQPQYRAPLGQVKQAPHIAVAPAPAEERQTYGDDDDIGNLRTIADEMRRREMARAYAQQRYAS